jgi:hypothetical protein
MIFRRPLRRTIRAAGRWGFNRNGNNDSDGCSGRALHTSGAHFCNLDCRVQPLGILPAVPAELAAKIFGNRSAASVVLGSLRGAGRQDSRENLKSKRLFPLK